MARWEGEFSPEMNQPVAAVMEAEQPEPAIRD
jgi:hypothetical protein